MPLASSQESCCTVRSILLGGLCAARNCKRPFSASRIPQHQRPRYLCQQKLSVYEYVVYDSEVERTFASQLDAREDIKLFVKLPGWFQIDTPVGTYNPDWAILKHDGQALYLVRETKGTRDFLQLRTSEADKIRCGQQHFETLGVPFAVAVSADDV